MMRIFVQSTHRYPANIGGPGGGRVFDWLVKGLVELGHDVYYYLEQGTESSRIEGLNLVDEPMWNADILHTRSDSALPVEIIRRGYPWVATSHVDLQIHGKTRQLAQDNWIYVSKTLAHTYNSQRFVLNGIDPSEFSYSETKHDYFLFVSTLSLALRKGLQQAISTARRTGYELVVAGSDRNPALVRQIARLCDQPGVRYVGDIFGTCKADLFAGAKALLFPTHVNEAFGLVLVEAMISGTPVICSANGACPEIVSPDVGFVCNTPEDYVNAVDRLDEISPKACRNKAMTEFHYLRMAFDYVVEYEAELQSSRTRALPDSPN